LDTAFGHSTPYSVGLEEEYQLVDETSLGLVSRIEPLLASFAVEPESSRVKPELLQSFVEVSTKVASGVAEAVEDLAELRSRLRRVAADQETAIISAGAHPFSYASAQSVTARPRYARIADDLGWLAHRHLAFGLHVHIGVNSAEKAIACCNGMRAHLPELLALSGNSPFWHGEPTGFASTRATILTRLPRSGPPPHLYTFRDFEELVERCRRAGCFPDYTRLWWDIRPHPRLGTVEVRICDAQTRLESVASVTALIQSLAATIGSAYECGENPQAVPDYLLEENRWRAARDGLDAVLIDAASDTERSARAALLTLLDRCEPAAEALGCADELDRMEAILDRGNGADEQRAVLVETGSLVELARFLVDQTSSVPLAQR
jgi:carboxylate-amine ligase